MFHIKKHGKLYYLQNFARVSVTSVCAARSFENWHRTLGHCKKDHLRKLEKIVNGMNISKTNVFNCETCVLGKQSQVISRKPDGRANSPLEFIHTDICGPISTVTKEGFNYVISFSADFSGFVFTYFLKTKSEASAALEKFLSECAPFGNVKRIRPAGGGEFIGKNFKSILTNRCIKHEMTAPYSPPSKRYS